MNIAIILYLISILITVLILSVFVDVQYHEGFKEGISNKLTDTKFTQLTKIKYNLDDNELTHSQIINTIAKIINENNNILFPDIKLVIDSTSVKDKTKYDNIKNIVEQYEKEYYGELINNSASSNSTAAPTTTARATTPARATTTPARATTTPARATTTPARATTTPARATTPPARATTPVPTTTPALTIDAAALLRQAEAEAKT